MKGYIILVFYILKYIYTADAPTGSPAAAGYSSYPLSTFPIFDYTESDWPRTCKMGLSQTPIDIPKLGSSKITVKKDALQILSASYKPVSGPVFKNDYNTKFGMNVTGFGNLKVMKNNITYSYDLADLHVHVLSEHTFDGVNSELEMHLVHFKDLNFLKSQNITDPDNNIALVIGILFKVSDDAFNINIQKLNVATSQPVEGLDLSPYVQSTRNFFHYSGGLTTPGCLEIVNWVVLSKFEYISPAQFEDFKKMILSLYPTGNGRLTKPLYGRPIYYVENSATSGFFAKISAVFLIAMAILF